MSRSSTFSLLLVVVLALGLTAAVPAASAPPAAFLAAPLAQDGGMRIQFDPGSAIAWQQGYLAPGGSDRYVLRASAGQTLSLSVFADNNQAVVVVWGADGTVLLSDHASASQWSGPLPSTQDYYLDVRNVGSDGAYYTLQVAVPPTPAPAPDPDPQRIRFSRGGSSATVQGQLPGLASDRYVLNVQAGQTLQADISSGNGQVNLAIWGADGTVLISDHADAPGWSGPAPSSQDYLISVINTGYDWTGYSLRVVVPPGPAPQPTPVPQPTSQRIQFPSGGSSATVQGSLGQDGVDRWLLRAQAGQTLSAVLSANNGQAMLVIWGADGTVLLSDHAGATQWSGSLPSTQDYIIDVHNWGAATGYALTVTVPPAPRPQPAPQRIRFARGATYATVQGVVESGGARSYILGAAAGQTLSAALSADSPQAYITISGADGAVLISDHAGATRWSGPLPSTQDYIITVLNSGPSSTGYSLLVTIPPR